MSDHSSDNEDVRSQRSDSPEQNERQLPKHNPSNIRKDATISDSTTAKKSKKKPKMAGRTAAPSKGDSFNLSSDEHDISMKLTL